MTNVIFRDVRKVIELSLPSYPESKVILYDGLLFGQMKKVSDVEGEFDKGVIILQHLIKEWNFTNEKGEALPINEASLSQLGLIDMQILMEKAGKVLETISKKKVESSKE